MKLLLHVCCGPCSTHVAEILSKDHEIVGYFYNPNIYPYEEWLKRYEAFKKVATTPSTGSGSNSIFPERSVAKSKGYRYFKDYFPKKELTKKEWEIQHKKFLEAVRGLENEPEGGKRCGVCFKLRLDGACKFAKELKILSVASTLTIGLNKKAEIINPIGKKCAEKYGIKFYEADFKKKDGFLHSTKMSKEMGLYRQRYCGCEFSMHA